jgi:hypothetical protein
VRTNQAAAARLNIGSTVAEASFQRGLSGQKNRPETPVSVLCVNASVSTWKA